MTNLFPKFLVLAFLPWFGFNSFVFGQLTVLSSGDTGAKWKKAQVSALQSQLGTKFGARSQGRVRSTGQVAFEVGSRRVEGSPILEEQAA